MLDSFRQAILVLTVVVASAHVACAQQSLMQELNTLCQAREPNTDFGPPQMFGEPLRPESRQDQEIREKYGAACFELARQDGLDFGPGLTGYTCSTAFTPFALRPGKFHEFNAAHHAIFGGTLYALRDRDVMHAHRGMSSVRATLIILADADGATVRVLFTNTELDRDLIGVRSLAAALDVAALRSIIPPTSRINPPASQRPACSATRVDQEHSGWTVFDAKVDDACLGTFERTIRISRSGHAVLVWHRSIRPFMLACD